MNHKSIAFSSTRAPSPATTLIDSFQIQVGVRNQQNLYPRIPTTDVAKLLQYSGSRVEHRDGFSA